MKNKLALTVFLIAGFTFISSYNNHLFGQTKQSKTDIKQDLTSNSMDEKNMKMMNDTTQMSTDGMSNKSMGMKADNMNLKNDTTNMGKTSMSNTSMDMKSDKMKMKNDSAMMKKEKM